MSNVVEPMKVELFPRARPKRGAWHTAKPSVLEAWDTSMPNRD